VKILILVNLLVQKSTSKSIIRGMLGAEIDFIILEYDSISNIAIASRIDAMELRASIEIPKLKQNDTIKVRTIAVGVKNICSVRLIYIKKISIISFKISKTECGVSLLNERRRCICY
jgi:hypothetical protein